MTMPMAASPAPMLPPPGPPPTPPWTPFTRLPMDTEPFIAALRQRRLAKLMATARFTAQPAEWQQMVEQEYAQMRQAVAVASQPPQSIQANQQLAAHLEQIRLTAALNPKAPAQGAQAVEAQTIQRDQGFLPQGGSSGASGGSPSPAAAPAAG